MRFHFPIGALMALLLTAATASAQATPPTRQPAQPIRADAPTGDDSRQFICRGATPPAGYIVTDDIRDRQMCGGTNMTTLNSYNVWVVERYDRMPVNTTMDVCSASPTPTGWVLVDIYRRKDRCGHPDAMFEANVKRIRRVQ
jgi:hypothetical protein